MLKVRKVLIASAVLSLSQVAMAVESEKKFEVYGFAQSDYIQDYRRVNPNWDTTLRSSKIPTQEGQFGSDGQAIISVQQSRFGVKGDLPVNDKPLYTKFEFDMFGVGKDEGQTTIRLRHAYGEYGKWLGGQTHSLFMDIDAFPNVIDYWGPSGMVFLRNPQLRYSFLQGENQLAIALEKPSNDIDPGQARLVSDELGASFQSDEKYPDVTAMGRINRDWGHIQLSGIVRSVGFETTGGVRRDGRKTGYGFNLSTTFKVADKDKLYLTAVHGNGIANYMNDGGTDLAASGSSSNLRPKLVPLTGLMAYYDHSWTDKYTTTLGYATTYVTNTRKQNSDAFQKAQYASVNLLYTPVKNVMFGGEVLWGSRTDKNGDFGDDIRTQLTFKYSFSSLDFI